MHFNQPPDPDSRFSTPIRASSTLTVCELNSTTVAHHLTIRLRDAAGEVAMLRLKAVRLEHIDEPPAAPMAALAEDAGIPVVLNVYNLLPFRSGLYHSGIQVNSLKDQSMCS